MKTILITGANRGIGLGLVRNYLNTGWRVIAAARDTSALKDLACENLLSVQLDVTDEASIARAARELEGESLDVLVNNAGISLPEHPQERLAAILGKTFAVNATGPMLVAQALIPLMVDGGKVINISSGMGSLELNINPTAGLDAYAMSKAALNMLSRHLAEQLRARGIIVVAMSPGWVRTEMGGSEATSSIEESVEATANVIEHLTLDQSGGFLAHTGEALPW